MGTARPAHGGSASAGHVRQASPAHDPRAAASAESVGGNAVGTAQPAHGGRADGTDREARRQAQLDARRRDRAAKAFRAKVVDLEDRIARCESSIKDVEMTMGSPGFYEDRIAAQPVIDRHQGLMWQVGDLMHQWEELQTSEEQTALASSPGSASGT